MAGVGQRRQAAGRVELLHLGDATAARVGAQVLPQQVVREVRELTLVPACARGLDVRRERLGVGDVHEIEDLVAMGARIATDEVRQRVGVRRHEVHRPAGRATAQVRRFDGRPPPLRRAAVLRQRACEQAHREIARMPRERSHAVVVAIAEGCVQRHDVGRG
ncbi:MAG: hypothetical protein IPK74_24100 [Deltaproteobacteria bacterium]|nr:hypothetical protein [Deltaproteobacteria bacterium]